MKEYPKPVKDALKKAYWMIEVPQLLILLFGFLLLMLIQFILIPFIFQTTIPKVISTQLLMVVSLFLLVFPFIIVFIFFYIFRNYQIPKWKIWVLHNIEEEVNLQLIKKEITKSHFMKQNEKWLSEKELKKINILTDKIVLERLDLIEKEILFEDTESVPKSVNLYFSKAVSMYFLVFSVLCMIGLIYLIINVMGIEIWIMSVLIVSLLPPIILFIKSLKSLNNNSTQLIISNQGIQSVKYKKNKLIEWSDIIEIILIKNGFYYLMMIINHPELASKKKKLNIPIYQYAFNPKEIEHLIEVYRGRYKKGSEDNI